MNWSSPGPPVFGVATSRFWWGAGIFVGSFVLSLVVCGVVLVRLPATYFLDRHDRRVVPPSHPVVRWGLRVVKNVVGVILVGAGVVMLVMPGQGLLTVLIGVTLLDIPGKRRLERKLIGRPKIFRAINRFRARFGKPPLILDEESPDARTPSPSA